ASGEQMLQISAPITHGNSGGPAIDQRGAVVGLATFGNANEVQGFNFLVASQTVLDLIKDTPIKPRSGETDAAWRAGLEHYWADEYTEAIAKFEEVATLFPEHSEATNMIRLAHQAQKDGKERKPGTSPVAVGVVFGAGIAVVGGLVAFRRRRRPQPAAPPTP